LFFHGRRFLSLAGNYIKVIRLGLVDKSRAQRPLSAVGRFSNVAVASRFPSRNPGDIPDLSPKRGPARRQSRSKPKPERRADRFPGLAGRYEARE
jgi:hypothetical protein